VKKPGANRQGQIGKIKASRSKYDDASALALSIREGSRTALARGITLIESQNTSDRLLAQQLLRDILQFSGNSLRIGISGVPGAGKSTFIEAFGTWLCERGHKVAVLAVDPSSELGRGSILGDKTRMNELAANANAFIRPSPSSGNLGGVARKTRESIYLCEAAGFDVILVETVGVGQNETAVHHMVDLFMLLALAGSGDELQGIKRGITEMADVVLVNKADGDNLARSKAARQDLIRALHFMPEKKSGWTTEVLLCSALEKNGLKEAWETISRFAAKLRESGYFEAHRNEQLISWLHEQLKDELWLSFIAFQGINNALKSAESEVLNKSKSTGEAVAELLDFFRAKH
jgi:LAO/AO transport system kinase